MNQFTHDPDSYIKKETTLPGLSEINQRPISEPFSRYHTSQPHINQEDQHNPADESQHLVLEVYENQPDIILTEKARSLDGHDYLDSKDFQQDEVKQEELKSNHTLFYSMRGIESRAIRGSEPFYKKAQNQSNFSQTMNSPKLESKYSRSNIYKNYGQPIIQTSYKKEQDDQDKKEKKYKFCGGFLDSRDSCCFNFCKVILTIILLPFILVYYMFSKLICPCLRKCCKLIEKCCDYILYLIEQCMEAIYSFLKYICNAVQRCFTILCTPVCRALGKCFDFICDKLGILCNAICLYGTQFCAAISKCCDYVYDKIGRCMDYFICEPLAICCRYVGKCMQGFCNHVADFCALMEIFCDYLFVQFCSCIDYFICVPILFCCKHICNCLSICYDKIATFIKLIFDDCVTPCCSCIWKFISFLCRNLWLIITTIAKGVKSCILYICTPICDLLYTICKFIYDYILNPLYQVIKKVFQFFGDLLVTIGKLILQILKGIYDTIHAVFAAIASLFKSKSRRR